VKRLLTITRRPVVITEGPKITPEELHALVKELNELRKPTAAKKLQNSSPKCPTCGRPL